MKSRVWMEYPASDTEAASKGSFHGEHGRVFSWVARRSPSGERKRNNVLLRHHHDIIRSGIASGTGSQARACARVLARFLDDSDGSAVPSAESLVEVLEASQIRKSGAGSPVWEIYLQVPVQFVAMHAGAAPDSHVVVGRAQLCVRFSHIRGKYLQRDDVRDICDLLGLYSYEIHATWPSGCGQLRITVRVCVFCRVVPAGELSGAPSVDIYASGGGVENSAHYSTDLYISSASAVRWRGDGNAAVHRAHGGFHLRGYKLLRPAVETGTYLGSAIINGAYINIHVHKQTQRTKVYTWRKNINNLRSYFLWIALSKYSGSQELKSGTPIFESQVVLITCSRFNSERYVYAT